jgi:hypothetical protein
MVCSLELRIRNAAAKNIGLSRVTFSLINGKCSKIFTNNFLLRKKLTLSVSMQSKEKCQQGLAGHII